jgi:hypothetical protein
MGRDWKIVYEAFRTLTEEYREFITLKEGKKIIDDLIAASEEVGKAIKHLDNTRREYMKYIRNIVMQNITKEEAIEIARNRRRMVAGTISKTMAISGEDHLTNRGAMESALIKTQTEKGKVSKEKRDICDKAMDSLCRKVYKRKTMGIKVNNLLTRPFMVKHLTLLTTELIVKEQIGVERCRFKERSEKANTVNSPLNCSVRHINRYLDTPEMGEDLKTFVHEARGAFVTRTDNQQRGTKGYNERFIDFETSSKYSTPRVPEPRALWVEREALALTRWEDIHPLARQTLEHMTSPEEVNDMINPIEDDYKSIPMADINDIKQYEMDMMKDPRFRYMELFYKSNPAYLKGSDKEKI